MKKLVRRLVEFIILKAPDRALEEFSSANGVAVRVTLGPVTFFRHWSTVVDLEQAAINVNLPSHSITYYVSWGENSHLALNGLCVVSR